MTLAPTRPTAAPTDPAGAEPTVTAVVVTRRDPAGLARLLSALFAQTLLPTEVLLLDRTQGRTIPASEGEGAPAADVAAVLEAVLETVGTGHPVPVTVVATNPRTPVRAAAHRALAEHDPDAHAAALAWFLPVGVNPEPTALVTLVDTWRRSASVGIVGPKHVDDADPGLLRALSIHTTRGGRLLPRPGPREARPGPARPRLRRPRRPVRRLPRRARPAHRPARLGDLVRRPRCRPRPRAGGRTTPGAASSSRPRRGSAPRPASPRPRRRRPPVAGPPAASPSPAPRGGPRPPSPPGWP